MYVVVCDICKRCIIGNDPSKDATMRFEDLFGSRTFYCQNPTDDLHNPKELTLCTSCKEVLYYTMENRDALSNAIQANRLSNRLRFLFKLPLQIKGGENNNG